MNQIVRLGVITWVSGLFAALSSYTASADWVILPTSYQQLYESYGLYIDRQNTLTYYGKSQVWAAVGGELPIFGNPDSPTHPAVTLVGTGNFGLYFTDNYRFYTQNIDARVGMGYEQAIDDQNRFEASLMHQSAHTADGVVQSDIDIIQPGVGAEYLDLRFIHDFPNLARVGGEYRPFLRSDPAIDRWASFTIFGELFPFGVSENPHHATPYLASALEVWGPTGHVVPTYHLQLGVYWGNHLQKVHSTSMRAVAGYYGGADPRLKYFSLLATTAHFFYFGMMFDL